MGNMSYCRWQNTLRDLRDCYDNDLEERSEEEERAFQGVLKLCRAFAENYPAEEE